MKLSSRPLPLTLGLILLLAPACDGGDDKKDADKAAKADTKKDDGADKKDAEDKAAADKAAEAGAHAGHDKPAADEAATVAADGRVEINVDAGGYHPAQIEAPPKSKVTLVFTRTTEAGCGQKLVVKSMELEKELPLNEAVEIEIEVPETGEVGFACGMDMYKGKVVAKAT